MSECSAGLPPSHHSHLPERKLDCTEKGALPSAAPPAHPFASARSGSFPRRLAGSPRPQRVLALRSPKGADS